MLLVGLQASLLVTHARAANNYNPWRNGYSNLCLDIPSGNAYDGQIVQQYTCNGGQNQLWTLYHWYDGAITFCSPIGGDPGYCIGRQQSPYNGAKAILYYNGADSLERWNAQSNGGVVYTFHSLYDARCLDDPGWSTSSGTWQQVWDCTGNSNQTWYW